MEMNYLEIFGTFIGIISVSYTHLPVFRYAEILLNYVEALNELKGEPDHTFADD